ncbi:hypothetical protein HN935_03755 [archaeon]|nr:hypothetical protein [archaeon]
MSSNEVDAIINGAVLGDPVWKPARRPAANRVQIERALREGASDQDEIIRLLNSVARVGGCTPDAAKRMISYHEEWISGCNLYDSIRMAIRRIGGEPLDEAYALLASKVIAGPKSTRGYRSV